MINQIIIRFFRTYAKDRKGIISYSIFFSLLQSLLLIPSIYFIKKIFDSDIPRGDIQSLIINSTIIIAITLLQSIAAIFHRNVFLKVVKGAIKDLQQDILSTLIRADRKFYDSTAHSEIINRAVNDVDQVDKMIDGILSVVIPQFILFAIGVLMMTIYNPLIGCCTLLLGFLGFILQRNNRKKVFEKIRGYNEAKDGLTDYVNVLPSKQIFTKMRNAEEAELEDAVRHSEQLIVWGTKAAKAGWRIKVTDDLIVNISATLLIVIGAIQILMGVASYGNIFGLYFLIVFIRRSVTYVQTNWTLMQEGIVSLERIFDMIDRLPTVATNVKKPAAQFDGALQIKQVSFGYNENWILNAVDLEISKSEIIHISGLNGSGKSSLLNLILGFYIPWSGEILASGTRYADLDVGELRTKIGYVPQQQVLLKGTIESNLLYGQHNSDPSHLDKLQTTNLYAELMSGFKNGLQTIVDTNGKNLSQGQIQRISILRALIGQPALLILDEPGNHLDISASQKLIRAIKSQFKISVLIISHHDSFLEVADRSLTLTNGKLILL